MDISSFSVACIVCGWWAFTLLHSEFIKFLIKNCCGLHRASGMLMGFFNFHLNVRTLKFDYMNRFLILCLNYKVSYGLYEKKTSQSKNCVK